MIYTINDKKAIRKYLCNRLCPLKTINFNMFGNIVSVTLTHDDEMDEIHLVSYMGTRAYYYSFDKLVSKLESIFETLYQLDMDEHMDSDEEMPVYAYGA